MLALKGTKKNLLIVSSNIWRLSQSDGICRKLMKKSFSSFSGAIPSPNPHLVSILENNRKWVAETKLKDPEFFVNLGKTQKPKYLYFGCSDSRVPANQILGLGFVFEFLIYQLAIYCFFQAW